MKSFGKSATLSAACVVFLTSVLAQGGARQPAQKVDFNRDVRPVISKCLTCHGPDNGEGMAGLRLDSFGGATKALASGRRAIVPGKPDESELVKRIHATDGTQMPPAYSNVTLSEREKKILTDWIAQGAEYKEHWAFVRPVRPDLPDVENEDWPRNGIDHFILAELERNGLAPEQEADKRTLIRRVTLDLTGLPPTPDEVEAFLSDRSANAYEKVVDRLLASPRYGERMAMDWMDYSRYADSNGYQADYERFQWRWRDWVIEAFNRNMPYDEFTVWQIAGDMLPDATMEQRLATGFNRNHRINTEGGVIAEEWRVENVVDRMETTGAVFLGLTVGCARCHDHKYDPLSQKEFYRMFAYYNNVPESGTGEERPINHPPTMLAPTRAQASRQSELETELTALDAQASKRLEANARKAEGWKPILSVPQVADGLVSRTSFVEGGAGFTAHGPVKFDYGRATGAVLTSNEAYLDLGDVGDFERDQAFSFGAWVNPSSPDGSPFSRMESANAFRGWECSLAGGRPQAHIINRWPADAVKIVSDQMIPMGKWTHLFFTYDGSSKGSGFRMYIDGRPAKTSVVQDTLTQTVRTGVSAKIGRRTNTETFTGMVDDFALFSRELTADEVAKLASTHPAIALLKIPSSERTDEHKKEIARLWSLENDAEYARLDAARNKAAAELTALKAAIPSVMVMEEMPEPRECFVLERGQYDHPKEKVEPGLPGFLPGLPDGAPNNRLGFAYWVVSDSNPLTSRVTVNRLWERFFGAGIVETLEDFGTRAAYPSHPALLDWLATEFVRLDWDMKAMVRTLVMSATYRQSSALNAEKLEKDPENRLLSRGPRLRLPGEVIRDQALFVSGLLVEKLGGPSVYPYMPEKIWDETNFYGNLRNYQHAKDDGLYRRSLYTIWKRTAAPPNMLVFDVPSREVCRVQRARTNTPLQALTLMNDETFVEAARCLAQRMMREGGSSPASRLAYGFELVTARKPTASELGIMVGALDKRIEKYRGDHRAAWDLVTIGEARVDLVLGVEELAAYTLSASTLLNLDEAINKE